MSDEHELAVPEDEATEFHVTRPKTGQNVEQLKADLANAQQNISSLTAANAKWETYTHTLRTEHEQELASAARDLKDSQEKRRDLAALLEQKEQELTNLQRRTDNRGLEEQKDKAVKLAIQQTTKIDELKLKLHEGKVKAEQAEEKIRFLEKAIENLRKENGKLKKKPVAMDTSSSASHESCLRKIKELQDEILVLQEQLKIFKGDFDQERVDRENAQSEITKLETQIAKITERGRRQEAKLVQKEKENAALQETNRELQKKLQKHSSRPRHEGSNYDIHIHSRAEGRRRKTPSPEVRLTDRETVNGLITESQKRHIRGNWTSFMNYLQLADILPQLFSVGVISLMEKEEIESKATSYQKNEHFLTHCLLRATQTDLKHFKSALIDSYQKHLADLVPPPTPTRPPTHTREEPMDIPPAENYRWQCKDCTFMNSAGSSNCKICRAERSLQQQPRMETLVSRGVDQCDNPSPQGGGPYLYDDVEED